MRSRTVLFIVLAVAIAFAAAYLGVSAGAPKAAGKPPTATTASSPAGSTDNRTPGPGPARSPTAPSQQTGQTGQKMGSPKADAAEDRTAQGRTAHGVLVDGSGPTARLHDPVGPAAAVAYRPDALRPGVHHVLRRLGPNLHVRGLPGPNHDVLEI